MNRYFLGYSITKQYFKIDSSIFYVKSVVFKNGINKPKIAYQCEKVVAGAVGFINLYTASRCIKTHLDAMR